MIKKVLILLSSLFMFSCTNVATDGVDETKEDQMARLLEEANKVKTVINEKGEEVIVEEEVPVEANGRRSHIGMTRGEIMEYEMTRVSEEMNALHADVQQYQEKKAQLNAYQEKLENLKKLNDAGMR